MTLRRNIVPGAYYHIFNRAHARQTIFGVKQDAARFLFGALYFQSPAQFQQIGRIARTFDEREGFDVSETDFSHVERARGVELVAFCVMPNHYHLLVRELVDGGIASYMQRLGTAYTKYFQTKYQVTGHVFENRYRAKLVADNEYLTHLSAYIHRNPRELKAWKGREVEYPWSSYQDYVTANRWGGLLAQEIILDQFEGTPRSNYADFVRTSPAKLDEFEKSALDR